MEMVNEVVGCCFTIFDNDQLKLTFSVLILEEFEILSCHVNWKVESSDIICVITSHGDWMWDPVFNSSTVPTWEKHNILFL